jgi:Ca-activated chloride channel homolog
MISLMDLTPLWGLLLLLPFGYAYLTTQVNRPKKGKRWACAFRLLSIILIILALCRPFAKEANREVHRTYLVDLSASISLEDVKAQIDRIEKHINLKGSGASWSLFGFARAVTPHTLDSLRSTLDTWTRLGADSHYREETRLASAILATRFSFPSGVNKELIIFSDGSSTEGKVADSISLVTKEGIHVSFAPLKTLEAPEACVMSLTSSAKSTHFGEVIRLEAVVRSNTDMPVKVKLMHQGVLEQEKELRLTARETQTIHFDTIVRSHGRADYSVELLPEKDRYPGNNNAHCSLAVRGKAKVVVIHQKPTALRAFKKALSAQGFDVQVRDIAGMPQSLTEMLEFDAIVLANIPATAMNDRQMRELKAYVTQFGGGLMMTGSENSFGLGGYYKTPVEDVLPLVSRYEKEKETPSLAMVLVIDKSGSMNGIKIQMAQLAARSSVELLSPRDQVAVLAFDGASYQVCSLRYASDLGAIVSAINSIAAGGGTNMYPAMEEAHSILKGTSTRLKHVILLGDGQSSPGPFENLASEMASSGITLSTIALGEGADASLMKRIADISRGRFYHTMDPQSVPSIFTRETMEASRSAIREELFTPVPVQLAPFLSDIDAEHLPFLLGHLMARPKPTAKTYFITDSGDPLLSVGRFGLGQSVAFTSDISEKWAGEWLEWAHFGKFWAQVLRTIVRSEDSNGVLLFCSEEGALNRYSIHHKDQADRPVSTATWEATVIRANGSSSNTPVRPIGLGRYEVSLPKWEESYRVVFRDTVSGKHITQTHVPKYPAEYHLDDSIDQVLQTLPRWNSKELRQDQITWTRASLVPHFIIMSLLSMMIGIVFRRV